MKRKSLFLFTIIICGNLTFAQNRITQTEKLTITAKIWGFLKYYHPQVSKGKFDWDTQLIEKIPEIIQTDSKEELNELFLNWINTLGKVKNKKKDTDIDDIFFDKNFNFKWLKDSNFFNQELIGILKNIEVNRNKGKKHYLKQQVGKGNIQIVNEKRYSDTNIQDYKYRLLSLFRYWNIIEYFFPYKYQTDQNWDSILNEMIPKFIDADEEPDFHLSVLELISKIDDSHSFLLERYKSNYFGKYWVPFDFKIIEEKIVITSFYNQEFAKVSDLKIGDIVTKIEGVNAMETLKNKLKYVPASNLDGKYKNAYKVLFNGNTDKIKLTIETKGQIVTKDIKRYLYSEFNYKLNLPNEKWEIKKGNIGYINLGKVKSDSIIEIMQSLKSTKALILDLRYGVIDLWGGIGQFLKSERRPFAKILKPDLSYPGKFKFLETKKCCYKRDDIYKGKVILLVNEDTQSHGEYTGMVFQTGDNVITIGSQTAGADGSVSYIPIIGNYVASMSGVGIFYPNGDETQRKGLKIDIEIKPTINGIRDDRDEVLEKALEIVKKQ